MKKIYILAPLLVCLICISANAGINDGLIAYYPFNGSADDESGNENHGTVYGATLTEDRFGNVGSAYYFDGIDDWIRVNHSNSASWTIAVWIKFNGPQGATIINTDEDDPDDNDYNFNLNITNYDIRAGYEECGDWFDHFVTCPDLSANEWYFIAGTRDAVSGKHEISRNGVSCESGTWLDTPCQDDNFIGIAHIPNPFYSSSTFYHGVIDDIRIYNRALSASEIQTLYEYSTLITLSTFTAAPSHDKVIIRWTTDAEIDNAGFNLYRADGEDGEYVRINDDLIPAQGSPSQGADYEFTDNNVQNRQTYWYMLEDVDVNGVAVQHGPVSAMPRLIHRD